MNHRLPVAASRITISAVLACGLLFAELEISTTAYGQSQPLPTINATPAPTVMPSNVVGPISAAQQTSEQIASVSQQVTQAVQDQSLPIDAKIQRINTLAAQFNQLVVQWQQQLAQISLLTAAAPTPPSVAGVQATPSVVSAPSVATLPSPTPTPNRPGG